MDGKIHDRPQVRILDEQREADLRKWEYEVVRFSNEELFQNIETVLQKIKQKVEELLQAQKNLEG